MVLSLNASAVNISWNPPLREHRNGIIRGYIIHVSSTDSEEEFNLSINVSEITISDLHPFYSYRFSVAAFNEDQHSSENAVGPFSKPTTLKMPESGMYAPSS